MVDQRAMETVLSTPRLDLVLLEPEEARMLVAGGENGHPWADGYPMGSTLLSAELTLAAAAGGRPLGAFGSYQIIRREDGAVIGDAGFVGPPDETGAVTVGCAIIESARGQGYATEAMQALLDWAATQSGLTCVLAEATKANPAAQRLLEKVGMHPVGEDDQLLYYMR
jgi:RimJ/RimL family protein N-acetyltransferase